MCTRPLGLRGARPGPLLSVQQQAGGEASDSTHGPFRICCRSPEGASRKTKGQQNDGSYSTHKPEHSKLYKCVHGTHRLKQSTAHLLQRIRSMCRYGIHLPQNHSKMMRVLRFGANPLFTKLSK